MPSPTAIVIEDEPQIRRFVRGALEAEGWLVHEAATLRQGLAEAGTRKPDLLVLDLGLPDGDGTALIRDVRGWSAVPIIVLSARTDEADKIAALDAGAEVHLTPIEYRLLGALITHPGRVLTHRQLLREVWGPAHAEQSHYLRIYMGHLRQKLEADPAQPVHLLTETAVGYRLVV